MSQKNPSEATTVRLKILFRLEYRCIIVVISIITAVFWPLQIKKKNPYIACGLRANTTYKSCFFQPSAAVVFWLWLRGKQKISRAVGGRHHVTWCLPFSLVISECAKYVKLEGWTLTGKNTVAEKKKYWKKNVNKKKIGLAWA